MRQLAILEQEQNFVTQSWTPVSFSDRLVEADKLRCLLENTNRTPSFKNEQPWNFIIASKDDQAEFQRLLDCLSEANAELVGKAPLLMLSVARLTTSLDGERNNHAFRDARHAVTHLVSTAKAMGLTAQIMAGFNSAKARREFHIPGEYEPLSAIAIGYPAETRDSSIALVNQAEEMNRPIESFVFTGSWGQSSRLVDQASSKSSPSDSDCTGRRVPYNQPGFATA